MTRIAAYVPDLMDRSRVAAVADVEFVAEPADLAASHASVVVVDLSRAGVLEVLPQLQARVIGYAHHEREDVFEAARAAGCREAFTRAVFFRRLPELLTAVS